MRRVIFIAYLLCALGTFAGTLIRPALAFKYRELGASALEVSMLTSIYLLARGIIAPLSGYLGDVKIKRNFFVILGFIGWVMVFIGYYYAPSIYVVYALKFVEGSLSGALWPSLQTILILHTREDLKNRVMSLYFSVGILSLLASFSVLGFFYNFSLLLTIAIGADIIASGVSFMLPMVPPKKPRKETPQRKKVSSVTYKFIPFFAFVFFFGFFKGSIHEFLYIYIKEVNNLEISMFSVIFIVATAIGLLPSFLISTYADKYSIRSALVVSLLLGLIACAFLVIRSLYFSVVGTILYSSSVSAILPLIRIYSAKQTTTYKGSAIGLVNSISNLGSVISPAIAGYLYDSFEGQVLLLWGIEILLSGMFFILMFFAMFVVILVFIFL